MGWPYFSMISSAALLAILGQSAVRASTVRASTTVGDGFSSAPPTVWLFAALIAPVAAVLIRSLGP